MVAPEFIYLNEQAVRVSSWKQEDASGVIELVVIAQGETDRDQLLDNLSREPVMIRIGSASAIPMDVRSLDTRSSGSGPGSMHRVSASLWPEGVLPPSDPSTSPERVRPIEEKLDKIIDLLTEILNGMRDMR
jgi:hypothetical protein